MDDVRWVKRIEEVFLCDLKMFRYSGTDYVNGKIVEGIANSIVECQVKFYISQLPPTQ